MLDYITKIFERIISTWNYIVSIFAQKRWWDTRFVEYLIVFVLIYLVFFFILHKIYRFFLKSTNKQKEKFYYDSDAVLYQYQLENKDQIQKLHWISNFISQKSYFESYKLLLEKSQELAPEFTTNLQNSYKSYNNSKSRKKIVWFFLTILSLWIYAIFIEK